MRLIGLSILFLILTVVTHAGWCRRCRASTAQIFSFALISSIWLGGYLFIFFKCPATEEFRYTALALYILSLPVYLIFYHSLYLYSPSRVILNNLRRGACRWEELHAVIKEEEFIKPRLEELVKQKCVYYDGRFYKITYPGRLIAAGYRIYRWLLGRDKGG